MLLAPFAVVALGTHQGIMITMVLATIASLLMVPSMWRDIEWSKVGWIAIPAVISTPLASWVGTLLNTSLVYILVGLLVMVGLGAALLMPATSEPISGRSAQVLAGVGAGAGGVLAGVGGRSEEHTSELQSRGQLVCSLLLEKKKKVNIDIT